MRADWLLGNAFSCFDRWFCFWEGSKREASRDLQFRSKSASQVILLEH